MTLKKESQLRRVLAVLLAAAILFQSVLPSIAQTASAATETAKVTFKGRIYSYTESGGKPAENIHGIFSTTFGSGVAYCGEHGVNAPTGDSKGNTVSLSIAKYNSNTTIRKILYYGYKGPKQWSGFAKSSNNGVYQLFSGNDASSKTEACGIAVTAMALTKAYNAASSDGDGRFYNVSGYDGFMEYINSQPAPPSGFVVYRMEGGSNKQDIFTWEYTPVGKMTLEKSKASVSGLVMKSELSLAGAKYGVYTTKAAAENNTASKKVGTLTTTASGKTNTLTVDTGTYYVKETTAPDGYRLDDTVYTVKVTEDETNTLNVKDTPKYGSGYLKKTSTNSNTANNSNYSLKGAVYSVYASKTDAEKRQNRITTLTTDADGVSNTVKLQAGTYYVRELTAPEGFNRNEDIETLKVTDGKTTVLNVTDSPIRPTIQIVKKSSNPELTGELDIYSLEAAKYTIYREYSGGTATGKVNGVQTYTGGTLSDKVTTLTTKSTGKTSVFTLVADTYYIKETKAPANYEKDDRVYKVKLNIDDAYVLNVEDEPKFDPVAIVLYKVNKTTGEAEATGKGTLEGARFEVKYYEGTEWSSDPAKSGEKPKWTWIFKTDEDGMIMYDKEHFVSGDELYTYEGKPSLPYGTVTIQETAAPEGFVKDSTVYTRNIKPGSSAYVSTYNPPVVGNDEIYGDLEFTKVDSSNNRPMEGIEFAIISKTTGETVKTVVTDADGHASTADGSGKGTLVYDDYIVREVNTPVGYLPMEDKGVTISENNVTVDMGTFENERAAIATNAVSVDSGGHTEVPSELVKIKDTVTYKNLIADQTYTLKGWLMDKSTGEPLMIDGEKVETVKEFEASTSDGSVDMDFSFDAGNLAGKTIVVYEEMYLEENLIAVHTDINDADQSVTFTKPDIDTSARLQKTGLQVSQVGKDTVVVDTVYYEGLVPGNTYTVSGELMDADSGKAVSVDGVKIENEVTFKPAESSGAVEVSFTFDSRALKGQTIVVYERLYAYSDKYEEGLLIAKHTDISDADQMIHFTDIDTSAVDKNTGTKVSFAEEKVTIADTIYYRNLIAGDKYTVKGILMDKSSGEPLLVKGEQVTSEFTFTPGASDGNIEVEFKFDGSDLKGKTVVVFESIYTDGVEIASHADINDENQSVYFPLIGTKALDKESGTNITNADDKVTIVDTVKYENLSPGREYTISGILMNKDTGKALSVGGVEITSQAVFTPESSSGAVDVEFTFDGSLLSGTAVVVYETLCVDGVEVANHKDINDDDQTVFIASLGTKALDKNTGINIIKADDNTVIVDTVEYDKLVPGREYTVKGTLMDKSTGEPLVVNDRTVTAEVKFTPETSSGSIDVEFVFDGSGLGGKTLVVFEKLYVGDYEAASHTDIDDEEQTIYIPKIGTTALDSETNDHMSKADEKITIVDTVAYEGLAPGKEYTVRGVLINKATGEAVVSGGKEVTSEKTFVAESSEGAVDIEFVFDGSELAGTTVVAFETVTYEGVEVAVHADINDAAQTVAIPEIKTTAVDVETQTHVSKADEEVTIVDIIEYKNLAPGKEYVVKGTLMDKLAGKALVIDGSEVTSEKTFTAEGADGTVEVEFKFDGSSLGGKSVVVFESVLCEGAEIAVHADISDEGQTVIFPEITKVTINKVDMDTGELLTGAELELVNSEGECVEGWITDGTPYYIEGLDAGEYILREVSAPEGYLLAEEVQVTVKDTGEIQTAEMKDDYIKVEFLKVDDDTGEPLSDAHLAVYNSDSEEIAKWISTDEPYRIDRLPAGTYTMKELKAPQGYKQAEDITFEVKETAELQTIVMKDEAIPEEVIEPTDEEKPTPQVPQTPQTPQAPVTGDMVGLAGWMMVLLASCGTVAVLRVRRNRSK